MNPFKYMLIGAGVAALAFVTLTSPFEPQHASLVKEACTSSNKVLDGDKERSCGELQDKYNMEFLCDEQAAGSHCWVEVK
jgi:hypothetical protein